MLLSTPQVLPPPFAQGEHILLLFAILCPAIRQFNQGEEAGDTLRPACMPGRQLSMIDVSSTPILASDLIIRPYSAHQRGQFPYSYGSTCAETKLARSPCSPQSPEKEMMSPFTKDRPDQGLLLGPVPSRIRSPGIGPKRGSLFPKSFPFGSLGGLRGLRAWKRVSK